jgi:RND family efflux transporter MFP subunit
MFRWKIAGLVILSAAVVGCGEKRARAPRVVDPSRLPHVEIVDVKREPLMTINIDVTAQVEAMEKADLSARVQAGTTGLRGMRGFIKTIPKEIDIGLKVREGQTLIELELPDLVSDQKTKRAMLALAKNSLLQAEQAIQVAGAEIKEAEAQVQRYEADVNFKTLKQKRVEELVKSTALQPQLKEEADLELATSHAALETARAQVKTKKERQQAAVRDKEVAASKVEVAQSEVDNLNVLAHFTTIRAPFNGVITKRWVDSGDTIKDASMPLLSIQRTDQVRVLLDIPERYVPLVNSTELYPNADGRGDLVEIHIPALNGRVAPEELKGPVTRMSHALDPATRTMRAEVHLSNKAGHLRPGMYGTATVYLERLYNVLTIPSTALVRRDGELCVFCVELEAGEKSRGRARVKRVKLGIDDGKRVQVKEGLTGDELIIAKGNGVIHEGDEVIAVRPEE